MCRKCSYRTLNVRFLHCSQWKWKRFGAHRPRNKQIFRANILSRLSRERERGSAPNENDKNEMCVPCFCFSLLFLQFSSSTNRTRYGYLGGRNACSIRNRNLCVNHYIMFFSKQNNNSNTAATTPASIRFVCHTLLYFGLVYWRKNGDKNQHTHMDSTLTSTFNSDAFYSVRKFLYHCVYRTLGHWIDTVWMGYGRISRTTMRFKSSTWMCSFIHRGLVRSRFKKFTMWLYKGIIFTHNFSANAIIRQHEWIAALWLFLRFE